MTTDTKRIMDALAIAGATHRGKLELDSADCMELLGEVRRTQLNEEILTKSRDEAMRDLAECTAQLRDTSKQLNDSIAASMTSAQEYTELESDLAAARKALEPFAEKYSRVNRMYKGDGCERFDESYQSYQVRLGDLRAAARAAQSSAIDPGINISGTVFSYGEIERDGETIYGIILNTGREALLSQNDNTLGRDAVLFVAAKAVQSDGGKEASE